MKISEYLNEEFARKKLRLLAALQGIWVGNLHKTWYVAACIAGRSSTIIYYWNEKQKNWPGKIFMALFSECVWSL